MNILDIHTHSQPDVSYNYEVIQNCYPQDFNPVTGKYYSIGIHPWYIEGNELNWDEMHLKAEHSQVLAIGEAGLDKFSEVRIDKQEEFFQKQIKLSEELQKPLIIHGVKAEQELFRIKKEVMPNQPWILHGFRGGKQQAERFIQHGFYISIGFRYNKSCFEGIPLDKLFLETDTENLNINELYKEVAFYYSFSENEFKDRIKQNILLVFS